MKELAATIVRILHYLILIFSVFAPIFGDEFWLTMHAIAMPTMMMHWVTNENACSLTLLESWLRGKECDKTFMAEVLYPYFGMYNDSTICTLAFVWWLIGLYRLKTEYNFTLAKACYNLVLEFFRLVWDKLKGNI